MRFLRLLLIPLTLVVFMLILGAAVLIGRATPTLVLAVDLADNEGAEKLKFGMFDVNRRYLIRDSVTLPDVRESAFFDSTIRVLQRVKRDEFSEWAFSDIELRTGVVTPLMTITSRLNDRVRLLDLYPLDSTNPLTHNPTGRFRIYLYPTGEIYETDGTSSEARLVATVDPYLQSIQWLAGKRRALAITSESIVRIDLDRNDGGELTFPSLASAYPMLSWNDKYVTLRSWGFNSGLEGTIPVYDVETFEMIAEYDGYGPSWCGEELLYYTSDDSNSVSLHSVDIPTGAATSTLIGDLPPELPVGLLSPLDLSCNWLIAQIYPEGSMWLMHRPSAAVFSVGIVSELPEVTGDSAIYQALDGDMLQRWRIAPGEDGVLRPELLEEHRNLGSQVTYTDGYWRGVYMVMGKLLLVDMIAGTEIELISDDVRGFSVLE